MVHLRSPHCNLYFASLHLRSPAACVLLVCHSQLGPAEPPICILGPIRLHVCFHQGGEADGAVHQKPERHHLLARVGCLRLFTWPHQALCSSHS